MSYPEPCLCGALDCTACRGSDAYAEPDDDRTADALVEMGALLESAATAWRKGENEAAHQSLIALRGILEDITEAA